MEVVNSQARAIDSFSIKKEPIVKSEPVCAVQSKGFKSENKRVSFSSGGKSPRMKDGKANERKCFACGYEFPHSGDCPAKGKRCKTCKEEGHFASSKFCKKRANMVRSEKMSDEYKDRAYLFANHNGGRSCRPMMDINVGPTKFSILIDSGADDNILDESAYRLLEGQVKLNPSKRTVYPYGGDNAIPVLGEFVSKVSVDDEYCVARFMVVKGAHGNLLSFETSRELGVFNKKVFQKSLRTTVCCQVEVFL